MHSAPFRTRCLVGKFTSGQSGSGLLYRLEDMPGGRGSQFKFDRVHLLVRGSPFKFDRFISLGPRCSCEFPHSTFLSTCNPLTFSPSFLHHNVHFTLFLPTVVFLYVFL